MVEAAVAWLLKVLAVSQVGLPAVFLIAFISATLVPLGSEPVVFAMVKANPDMFWLVIAVATVGNTLGGAVNYGMGYGAEKAFHKERASHWFGWLERYGAKAMLLSWLPAVGDPLCLLAGWLKLPFWQCVLYMAIGKGLRYVCMTMLLLSVPSGMWQQIAHWLG
ncbi:YqaA family protein [Undibacterium cyanobacteriorum]|uniref:YqaA family protein n=1 Tax=Undibacterium cyanobacteriorum TaxID=3073561 RepID=A0ABY9RM53_9BURK|nr:YqaA family protein [Undibacterium sp. 20NA77.5]WMW81492.1 YqaA family protein [Undibacterium sp. 20NA77.5]